MVISKFSEMGAHSWTSQPKRMLRKRGPEPQTAQLSLAGSALVPPRTGRQRRVQTGFSGDELGCVAVLVAALPAESRLCQSLRRAGLGPGESAQQLVSTKQPLPPCNSLNQQMFFSVLLQIPTGKEVNVD